VSNFIAVVSFALWQNMRFLTQREALPPVKQSFTHPKKLAKHNFFTTGEASQHKKLKTTKSFLFP